MVSDPLKIYTLGGLSIRKGEEVVAGLETHKVEALLVYLAATRRPHPREVLAELFWEERPQRQSLVNLRVALTNMRKHVGEYLEIGRESVGLRSGAYVWLDAAEMEKRLEVLDGGQILEAAEAAHQLDQAIQLYQGEFLEGFYLRGCLEFEGWQTRQRERLHRLAVTALHDLAAYSLDRGDYPAGIAHATRLLELDPLMESAHRQMMKLLALSGKRALALKQYETLSQTLDRELSVEPEIESQNLYEDIRAGRFHREFAQPYETHPSHNLPSSLTPFLGRDKELADLAALLEDPGCRLVTLAGPGGIGKTRLAIRVAESLLPAFPQGAWFVYLDPLGSPKMLVGAIGAALGLPFSGQVSPLEQLLESLRRKQLLMVLDNFEHLLPEGARLLIDILQAAPGVKLLVTSRERLNLQAESLIQVQGLAFPVDGKKEGLEAYPAVALFLQHARRVAGLSVTDEDRVYVARIARQVEGSPLALELTAAWARALSCHEIALEIERGVDFLQARQPDLPERHRSMRAVFDQSWRLLPEKEKAVFRRMSVFRGGFVREAASQVTGASLDNLAALVDKSLVQHHPDGRYRIHELLRQFVNGELERAGEAEAAREQHLAYFLDLAEQAEPQLWRDQDKTWSDRLESDYGNLRAALEWSLSPQSTIGIHAGLRLVLAIESFMFRRGYTGDAIGWLAALLAHPQAADHPKQYANGLRMAARLRHWTVGENEAPRAGYERSLAIAEAEGDPFTLAHVLSDFGNFCENSNDLTNAQSYLERSLVLYEELGYQPGIGIVLRRLGVLSSVRNEYDNARSYLQQSLQVWKALGNKSEMAQALLELGQDYFSIGEHAKARHAFVESLALGQDMNDKWCMTQALFWLGEYSRYQENYSKALSFSNEGLALAQETGDRFRQLLVLTALGFIFLRQGDGRYASERLKESLLLCNKSGETWFIAINLIGLAGVSATVSEPQRAARLLGVAQAMIESASVPLARNPAYLVEYERVQTQVQAQLDERTFSRLSQEGRAMAAQGVDQVLEYALQDA